ncbi:MAG TPA: diacylglycerol kinase family protein [Terracidiphilus sp.]|nr:diacylglycerol kinase family protein [Terracidiphilus sp.]
MRRVALIYNPASGQHANGYLASVESACSVLEDAGVEAEILPTHGPGTAGEIALQARDRGCDTVIACGGDGTVHEILQTLAGGPTALGVVPMGTANALAADLGLGTPPAKAVRTLLTASPVRVALGKIFYRDREGVERSRFFTVAAGVGADGQFFYRLDANLKRRFGYAAYLLEALHIWSTHRFPLFDATVVAPGTTKAQVEQVSQLLAVRIGNFGGVVRNLLPGAALRSSNLHLVAFKTRSRYRYLRFVTAVIFRRHTFSREIQLLEAATVECSPCNGSAERVLVEADGELLGRLPARIEIVPDALTLLIPPSTNS